MEGSKRNLNSVQIRRKSFADTGRREDEPLLWGVAGLMGGEKQTMIEENEIGHLDREWVLRSQELRGPAVGSKESQFHRTSSFMVLISCWNFFTPHQAQGPGVSSLFG